MAEGKKREIAAVRRSVSIKDANDSERDLEYWLAQPPAKRLEAVTMLVQQTLKEGQRMDRTVVNKGKLKDLK